MASFTEYASYDALGLAELVREQKVSPLELVDAAIERIESDNPRLNAVITKTYDLARDAALGELPDGPFRGVPFLLKDILAAFEGVPMASGSRIYRGWKPPGNSRLVDRFLRTGVVVLGKTNTPEFALLPVTEPGAFGPTKNPWNSSLTPGGSSGGSGAAVAARMVPMASGGDGGGSIRIPASCCGLFGLKPTRGRTPDGPFDREPWEGFAVQHVLTRTVRDSAAMLDATSGADAGETSSLPARPRPYLAEVMTSPGKLRIAFSSRSPLAGELHPECLAALEDAMNLLSELGHELHEITLDIDGGAWKRASTLMMCGICAADVRDAERRVGRTAVRRDFDRSTWLSRAVGESLTAGEYAHAVRTLERLGMQIAVALAGYDLWLTPTLGRPPLSLGALHPKGLAARAEELAARLQLGALARRSSEFEAFADRVFAFMPFTQLANAAGLPSMNVPLWWNPEGVPIGVMFTGRFGDEATLLRIAGQLEEARPWAHRKPPVL